jgi:glutathione S-transferase
VLRLYGTTTSPYVRRVRIVAAELGVAAQLVDTNTAEGQAQLRDASPVWKVPTAVFEGDGRTVLDSHAITEVLMQRHGPGPLHAFDPRDIAARNTIAIVDGALDALINALYLRRDGIEGTPYLAKQAERAAACMRWLDERVDGLFGEALSLQEIATITAIDWMRFREMYPVVDHPRLLARLQRWRDRPSVAGTMPG